MTDKPIRFESVDEIVRTRQAFDPTCVITRDNFSLLPGIYDFDKDALCQVESIDVRGQPCRTKHRKGWLGKRHDGKEGLIGSTCGPKYFEGHEGFATHRATVRRELDLDDLTARLETIAADPLLLPRVEGIRERLRTARSQSQSLLEALPDVVHDKLRAMAKSQNAALQIEVEFIEKVEDERTKKVYNKSVWVPQTVGSVTGLSIASRAPIHELGNKLSDAHKAFESLDARRELGTRKLRQQLKILDAVDSLETEVISVEAAWLAFARPDNLKNLWLLSRQPETQMKCMRVAAIAAGTASPSNNHLREALKTAESALRVSNGNRLVRPT